MVTCTDPLAMIDIPNLVREEGARLEAAERRGDRLCFRDHGLREAASFLNDPSASQG